MDIPMFWNFTSDVGWTAEEKLESVRKKMSRIIWNNTDVVLCNFLCDGRYHMPRTAKHTCLYLHYKKLICFCLRHVYSIGCGTDVCILVACLYLLYIKLIWYVFLWDMCIPWEVGGSTETDVCYYAGLLEVRKEAAHAPTIFFRRILFFICLFSATQTTLEVIM